MPYKNIKELPEGVRNTLSESEQHDWMSVFNSAYHGTCKGNDVCATKVAWGVHTKNKEGKKKESEDEEAERKQGKDNPSEERVEKDESSMQTDPTTKEDPNLIQPVIDRPVNDDQLGGPGSIKTGGDASSIVDWYQGMPNGKSGIDISGRQEMNVKTGDVTNKDNWYQQM